MIFGAGKMINWQTKFSVNQREEQSKIEIEDKKRQKDKNRWKRNGVLILKSNTACRTGATGL